MTSLRAQIEDHFVLTLWAVRGSGRFCADRPPFVEHGRLRLYVTGPRGGRWDRSERSVALDDVFGRVVDEVAARFDEVRDPRVAIAFGTRAPDTRRPFARDGEPRDVSGVLVVERERFGLEFPLRRAGAR